MRKYLCFAILLLVSLWLWRCSCQPPTLRIGAWRYGSQIHLGEVLRLDLRSRGGLLPPEENAIVLQKRRNLDFRWATGWRLCGVCVDGFCFKRELLAWPLDFEVEPGELLKIPSENLHANLPKFQVKPRNVRSPCMIALRQGSPWLGCFLCLCLLLGFGLPLFSRACFSPERRMRRLFLRYTSLPTGEKLRVATMLLRRRKTLPALEGVSLWCLQTLRNARFACRPVSDALANTLLYYAVMLMVL